MPLDFPRGRSEILGAVFFLLCGGCAVAAVSTRHPSSALSNDDVRDRVEKVFRDNLPVEPMEVDGQIKRVRTLPSESTLRALRHLGGRAVPFIAMHLEASFVEERILAALLLGNQGGPEIVAPLEGALHDPIPLVRYMAVQSLRAAPRAKVLELLQAAKRHDPDQSVRTAAQKLLDDDW